LNRKRIMTGAQMTTKTPNDLFSAREQEVVGLLLQGKSNKEIARELGITIRTVESHLGSIFTKLGVTSRTSAVIKLHEGSSGISTGKPEITDQGNPQLKKEAAPVILSTKDSPYRYLYRRLKTKTIWRLMLLTLLGILVIVIMIVIFAAMRDMPAAYFIP